MMKDIYREHLNWPHDELELTRDDKISSSISSYSMIDDGLSSSTYTGTYICIYISNTRMYYVLMYLPLVLFAT